MQSGRGADAGADQRPARLLARHDEGAAVRRRWTSATIAREVVHDLEVRIHRRGGRSRHRRAAAIDADPLQMRQLLQNLVGNGAQVPQSRMCRRACDDRRGDAATSRAEIIVSDNGIGFDEKYAERIFTMFERLHGRGDYEGTGIGLAICRKIAQRHGGDIRARSTPGEGATFTVTLAGPARAD